MRDRVVAVDRQFVQIERIVRLAVEDDRELRAFVGGALAENVSQGFPFVSGDVAEHDSPLDVDLASHPIFALARADE